MGWQRLQALRVLGWFRGGAVPAVWWWWELVEPVSSLSSSGLSVPWRKGDGVEVIVVQEMFTEDRLKVVIWGEHALELQRQRVGMASCSFNGADKVQDTLHCVKSVQLLAT